MYYRRKVLLGLLELTGGSLQRTDLQKLMLLFCKTQETPSYEFVPYKFGAFSFQSYADKRTLTKYGYLAEGDEWQLTDMAKGMSQTLKGEDLYGIKRLLRTLDNKRGKELVRETYLRFPYYAIRSEIAESVLSKEELEVVKANRPTSSEKALLTIGYEGVSLEAYLNKLIVANVKLLCDVRKNPMSMKWGFSKKQLSESCERVGITYMHIPALGIVSDKRKSLNTQADYDKLFEEYEATTLKEETESLSELVALINQHGRVAITCFESCEKQCHRGRIAKTLSAWPNKNFEVEHL